MRDLLAQIWANLASNRLRSFLTMFGIAWGVMTIVILSATGEGFLRGNETVLRELGKNIVIIRNGRTSLQAGGERAGRFIRLSLDDVRALQERATLLEFVSPELMRYGVRAKSPYNSNTLQMSGVWPSYQYMRTIEVDLGRPLRDADCAEAHRVVVLGFEASKLLFADRDPIGQELLLNGVPYRVVGRVRKKLQDSNYTGADDERLFIPYEAARRDFPLRGESDTSDSLSAIIANSRPAVVQDLRRRFEQGEDLMTYILGGGGPVEQQIRDVLGPRKGFDPADTEAISFWNTAMEAVMFEKMIGAMHEFFLAVSLITLALGGIGVMNIMLVSVRERTHEIGLRKALGAPPRVIQRQFFLEGLLLTLVSGTIGFALGVGMCALVNLLPMPARFQGMTITWGTSALAICALVVVRVAFSTYPARRAAGLAPAEALRYEL
jgi:putative ABC transport system permease protein